MAGWREWIWFAEQKTLGGRERQLLLDHFGSPEGIFYAEAEEFRLLDGLNARQIEALCDKSTAGCEKIMADCQRLGIRVLTWQDADYPARLRNIFDPPCVLYVRGTLPLIDEEVVIAMVGTRKATPYGIRSAEKLAFSLAKQGALVISGAAHGIDTAAHRGALRAGKPTLAVLGCGLDVVYPEENRWLYADIAACGALISEYPPGTAADGWHFPARNRILSGLSLAVTVVEAPERSGALITANLALEQGRDVFAVPGPIDAPNSRGCHDLIISGAGLAADSQDILRGYEAQYPHKLTAYQGETPQVFGAEAKRPQPEKKKESKREAAEPERPVRTFRNSGWTDDQIALLRAMQRGISQADDLIDETQIPTRRVLSALTMLEIEGCVKQESGRQFSLIVDLREE